MATCSFGPIVDAVRGSIGGVTFSRAGSGPTVRARPRPARPRALRQLETQTALAYASSFWPDLDPALKTAWSNYAATVTLSDSLGREFNPTGQQVFVWHNALRVMTGEQGIITDAPLNYGLPAAPALVFDYNSNDIRLFSITPALAADEWIFLSVFRADVRRAFPRTRIETTVYIDSADSIPLIVAPDIDSHLQAALNVRSHLRWRFNDSVMRQSTLQQTYLDFITT